MRDRKKKRKMKDLSRGRVNISFADSTADLTWNNSNLFLGKNFELGGSTVGANG